jgi:myo-inositol 2-dehydrogenase / D-chiro-inositol 1-dehydrogenase
MADSRSKLRLGFIGCGRVTETRHLPALRRLAGVEVVAAADIKQGQLERVAGLFHIKDRYADYQRLLADRSIDAVAVCVPAEFHVEVSLAALDSGKHLFVEKPLALSLEEADRLIERAGRSSRKVTVGFNMRWHRLVCQAREMIQHGALGPLQLIRSVFTAHHESIPEWRKRRELGGGVLFEIAVHHFDLWRFLLQSEVEEVFAASHSGEWEDEAATVTARMTNGVLATSVFSELTSGSEEVELYGRTGRLRVSCYDFDGLGYFPRAAYSGDLRTRLRQIAHTLRELPRGIRRMGDGGDFIASYRAEWRHFIDCIQRDTKPQCTMEDGRRALQVVLAAIESASSGRPVRIVQPSGGNAFDGTETWSAEKGGGKRHSGAESDRA